MPQAQQKKVTLTENQIIQMAQHEENEMHNKQAMMQRISHMLGETITSKEILKEAKQNKGKVMINIGATVLIEAQITNTEKCKRALSDNSYKEDTFEETLNWLEKKEEQIKKQLAKVQTDISQHQSKLTTYLSLIKQVDIEKKKAVQKAKQAPPTLSK
jgi:prefoldin subunit 5